MAAVATTAAFTAAVTLVYLAFEYFDAADQSDADVSKVALRPAPSQELEESDVDPQVQIWIRSALWFMTCAMIFKMVLTSVRSKTTVLLKWTRDGAEQATKKRLNRVLHEKLLEEQEGKDKESERTEVATRSLEPHQREQPQPRNGESTPRVENSLPQMQKSSVWLDPSSKNGEQPKLPAPPMLEWLDPTCKGIEQTKLPASPMELHDQEQLRSKIQEMESARAKFLDGLCLEARFGKPPSGWELVPEPSLKPLPPVKAKTVAQATEAVCSLSQSAQKQGTMDSAKASFSDGACLEARFRNVPSEQEPLPKPDLTPLPLARVTSLRQAKKAETTKTGLGDDCRAAQDRSIAALSRRISAEAKCRVKQQAATAGAKIPQQAPVPCPSVGREELQKVPVDRQPQRSSLARPRKKVLKQSSMRAAAPEVVIRPAVPGVIIRPPPGLEPADFRGPPQGLAQTLACPEPKKLSLVTPFLEDIPAPIFGDARRRLEPLYINLPRTGLAAPPACPPEPHKPGLITPVVRGIPAPKVADRMQPPRKDSAKSSNVVSMPAF